MSISLGKMGLPLGYPIPEKPTVKWRWDAPWARYSVSTEYGTIFIPEKKPEVMERDILEALCWGAMNQ